MIFSSNSIVQQSLTYLVQLLHFLNLLVSLRNPVHQHRLFSSSFNYLPLSHLVLCKLTSILFLILLDFPLLIFFTPFSCLLNLSFQLFIDPLPLFFIKLLFSFLLSQPFVDINSLNNHFCRTFVDITQLGCPCVRKINNSSFFNRNGFKYSVFFDIIIPGYSKINNNRFFLNNKIKYLNLPSRMCFYDIFVFMLGHYIYHHFMPSF